MVLCLTPIKITTIKLFSFIIGPQYYTSDMHEVQEEDTDPWSLSGWGTDYLAPTLSGKRIQHGF